MKKWFCIYNVYILLKFIKENNILIKKKKKKIIEIRIVAIQNQKNNVKSTEYPIYKNI